MAKNCSGRMRLHGLGRAGQEVQIHRGMAEWCLEAEGG